MKKTGEQKSNLADAKRTAKHLSENIGAALSFRKLDPLYCAYALEFTFGEEIHNQINGFIKFCKENNTHSTKIESTLCHDLGGALNHDKLMLPRVSCY